MAFLLTAPALPRPLLFFCAFAIIIILFSLYSTQNDRIIPAKLHDIIPGLHKDAYDEELYKKLNTAPSIGEHPIDKLIEDARLQHQGKLAKRSYDLKLAGIRYRKRRGRHPPPGFDKWVEHALANDAVLVEDFFDRIYDDLQPFWGVEPRIIAESAANWDHVVQVRDGKATPEGDVTGRVAWLQLWTDLIAECAEHLPDVDMPINFMDESRLLVPWETIDKLVKTAQEKQKFVPVTDAIQVYQKGVVRSNLSELGWEGHRPNWIRNLDTPMWNHVAETCPPDTPSHGVEALKDFSTPPEFPPSLASVSYIESGYVKNVTSARDPCQQPQLRGLHASVIVPTSVAISKELFPMFGGCKLPVNNEILIPGAMYLTDDPFYSGGSNYGPPWSRKTDTVTWRGVASGGRHSADNWRHWQRLRLIEMLNGTTVADLEMNEGDAPTFPLPPASVYSSAFSDPGKVGKWLIDHSDAGFTELLCWPPDSHCDYLADYYHEVHSKPMVEQYTSKLLPDVDGNSFSARYRALLLSTSLPIKATIYAEWHDDRLQPWLHYVPMDNTFQDLYGILDYFSRDKRGDTAAQVIAETGKNWAEQTLRRQDMLLYVWRLLLEFARVCNEDRDLLGYVDDLVGVGT